MTLWHWFSIAWAIVSFVGAVGIALLMSVKTSKENKERLAALGDQVNQHSLQLAGLEGLPRAMERQFARLDHINADVAEIKGTLKGINNGLGLVQRALLSKEDG